MEDRVAAAEREIAKQREAIFGIMRRIEAHRWISMSVLTALSPEQRSGIIGDLRTLSAEMQKRNEASEIIWEIDEFCRLAKDLDRPRSARPT